MKVFRNILFGFLVTSLLAGCIDDFEPTGLKETSGIMVIDGVITDGEFTVKLSTSIGLSEDFTGSEKISTAEVYVECSDGTKSSTGTYKSLGVFSLYCDPLDATKQYRLVVEYEGLTYASEFLAPMETPEIEYITWGKAETGAPVQIMLTSEESEGGSRYYGWKFREHWEVTSNLQATIYIDASGNIGYYDLTTSNNIYNCWGQQETDTFVLGTSDKLNTNRIVTKTIREIDPSDERLSVLYYIEVDQFCLRKDAYDYFENIKKNSEQTGGLFAPVPSEIPGNIHCLTDPSVPVIGYVEVSKVEKRGQFFGTSSEIYEPINVKCDVLLEATSGAYVAFQMGGTGALQYSTYDCVDCRRKPYASKNRPSWWITENF